MYERVFFLCVMKCLWCLSFTCPNLFLVHLYLWAACCQRALKMLQTAAFIVIVSLLWWGHGLFQDAPITSVGVAGRRGGRSEGAIDWMGTAHLNLHTQWQLNAQTQWREYKGLWPSFLCPPLWRFSRHVQLVGDLELAGNSIKQLSASLETPQGASGAVRRCCWGWLDYLSSP